MMNDMMPTIEETIDMNDIAQHEHEQWLRECEREERWAALEAAHEAKHGMPLLTATEWKQHTTDENAWLDEGICK